MARRNMDRPPHVHRQGSESSNSSWRSQSTLKDDRTSRSLSRNGSAASNRPDQDRVADAPTAREIYHTMLPESPSISPTDLRKPHRKALAVIGADDYFAPKVQPPPPPPGSGSYQLSLNPIAHEPFNTNWSSTPLQNQSPNPESGTFLRDASENENSPSTPVFRHNNGNASAFDVRDFGYRDDRRHSAASITTASSSNSKSSQKNGIRKHIHGLLGKDHSHGENGATRSDSDPSLRQPNSREHLSTRSRNDSGSSRYLSENVRTRAGSPSASRPLTPLPSSDVVPWEYQQFKDIPQYGQAPVRNRPVYPDNQRYMSRSGQQERKESSKLPLAGRRSKEGKPPSSGSAESAANLAVPSANYGDGDAMSRPDFAGLLPSTAMSSSSTLAGRPNSPTPSTQSSGFNRDVNSGQESPGPRPRLGFVRKLAHRHKSPHRSLTNQPGSSRSLQVIPKKSKRDASPPSRKSRQGSMSGNGPTRQSNSLDNDAKPTKGLGIHRPWFLSQRGSALETLGNRAAQTGQSDSHELNIGDLEDMTGILKEPDSIEPTDQAIFDGENAEEFTLKDNARNESWAPPESWEVSSYADDIYKKLPEIDNEPDIRDDTRMYFIRVFRIDSTFATLCAPLNSTVDHILHLLGKKSFLQDDLDNYEIVMRRNDLSRQLDHVERPILIQKRLLEQVGYKASDHIEDIGRDDHSYICRFVFLPTKQSGYASLNSDPGFNKNQKHVHVDLQGRSLVTIPITLYGRASEIITLNLSRNLSLNVPSDFITSCLNLREIKFTANEAWQLPSSFGKATRLTNLDISNNRLEQLDQANLADLQGLVSFKVANNKLSSLPSYFSRYTSLRSLTLSSNNFKVFPDILCELPSLVDLDISFNSIRELPNIGRLAQLERLWVTNNMLTGPLDRSFHTLKNIKQIDARFNEVTNIDSLMQLPRLEQLLLGHNSITKFKGSFPKLRTLVLDHCPITQFELDGPMNTLTSLNLASGKLVQLKDSIFDFLPHLTKLILDKNHFSSLSQNIGKLRRLEHFSMIKNTLSALPPTIGCLTELKYLNLRECNLDRLPSEIWCCSKLETLNVSSNLLKSFPKFTGQTPLAPGEYASGSPATTPGLSNTPSYENMANAGDGQSRRPSQSSGTLLNMSTPPGIGRNNSVVSYLTGGRKASTASRTYTDVSTSTRKDSNFSQGLSSTFSVSLRDLYLADNCLEDDIFAQLAYLPELRVLNLSYNALTELPQGLLKRWQFLSELYLSGNEFTSLPSDDLEETSNLKTLHINGNRFQVLPAELCKVSKLAVLDVGSNSLKYNVSNWPYDWNWNWNRNLRYLNFSGNKRLEIKPNIASLGSSSVNGTDLTGFNSLTHLRVLGLMDVTLTIKTIPEESEDRRVRTSASLAGSLAYGMADFLGKNEHLSIIDMMVPRLRSDNMETLVGMFDGQSQSIGGSKVAKFLHENFTHCFVEELKKLNAKEETPSDALRRTFLTLNKDMAAAAYKPVDDREVRQLGRSSTAAKLLNQDDINSGGVATVLYLNDMDLYVANVGDAQAVLVKADGSLRTLTFNHDPAHPEERARIRQAGGFVSRNGKLNDVLPVSRAFGYFPLMPSVIAAPHTTHVTLGEQDEMIIVASKEVWDYVTFDLAVDVARSEDRDLMIASQKIRDLAIAFGASNKLMVMILGISRLKKRERTLRPGPAMYPPAFPEAALPPKRPRRNRDAIGDSRLARFDYVDAPVGELAIIFTDIKKSTSLWETCPDAMRSAIQIHNDVLRRQLGIVGGYEVKTEGDAFMVAFATPSAALLWCFNCQMQLLEAEWPKEILEQPQCKEYYDPDGNLIFRGLSVRMGSHWGEPVCEKDPVTNRMDYFGPMVNRASRISAVADGGQIFVSSDFMTELDRTQRYYAETERSSSVGSASDYDDPFQSIRRELQQLNIQGFEVRDQGERKLKGLENPEPVYQVSPAGLAGRLVVQEGMAPSEELNPVTLQRGSKLDIDPNFIWGLWDVSLRLERLCSCLEVPTPINISTPKNSILHAIQNGGGEMTDSAILGLLDIQVTRLETSINTLALRHMINPFRPGDSLQDHAMPMGQIFAHLQNQLSEFRAIKAQLNLTNTSLGINPQPYIGLRLESSGTDSSDTGSLSGSSGS